MTGLRYIDIGAAESNTETLLPAQHFGPRGFENDLPSEYVQAQGDKVMTLTFNHETDTTTYSADQDGSRLILPANSYYVSAYVTCLVPYVGTDVTITLNDVVTDAVVHTVDLTLEADQATVGDVEDAALASVNIGTADLTIGVVADLTAGESILTLIYRTLDDRTGTNQS